MESVTSRQNSAVKLARKLHQKKYREQEKLFIIEGYRALQVVAEREYPVEVLFYSENQPPSSEHEEQVNKLISFSRKCYEVSADVLAHISGFESPQPILAVMNQKSWSLRDILDTDRYFLAINQIRDPGNMGTIIRSARAFACGGIFLLGTSVDIYNPKTVQASMGYVLEVPFFHFEDPDKFMKYFDKKGFDTYAFTPHNAEGWEDFNPGRNSILILGGETEGIEQKMLQWAGHRIRIPMAKGVESLNLSISASIIMHRAFSG